MAINKNVRNVAIVLGIAALVVLVPGGGKGVNVAPGLDQRSRFGAFFTWDAGRGTREAGPSGVRRLRQPGPAPAPRGSRSAPRSQTERRSAARRRAGCCSAPAARRRPAGRS